MTNAESGPRSELINEIKTGVGYGASQATAGSQQQSMQTQRTTQDYNKHPSEETRKPTVEEIYLQSTADVGGHGRASRMPFPSAPTSPTKQPSMSGAGVGSVSGGGGGAGGFMNTVTGQLTKARHLFSTETLNSIISDVKVPGVASGGKYKILLVIDHPLTDWSKYVYKRKIDGDWDIKIEQAQLNDISITASPEQGCLVTVHDGRSNRSNIRTFKPDFVLIRQALGAVTQHYENIITGLMFGSVPCMNSAEAVYNMRNKAWLFSNLLKIQKRLGAAEFPLITRSYQVKSQPLAPDFPMPVNVRLGGDSARECEVRVEDTTLYQSLMSLANNSQRYATTEPCIQSVCEFIIQKIGPYTKAFMRKPISNPSLSSSGSTVLERIPLSPKFSQWIAEVSQLFGGLDMCAIKALQDSGGEYYIQDVYGSDFILLGDGQEEDRVRIAEILLQRMEYAHKMGIGTPSRTTQPQVGSLPTKPASSQQPVNANSHSVFSSTSQIQEQASKSTFGQTIPQTSQQSSYSLHEQKLQSEYQSSPSGSMPSQTYRGLPPGGRPNASSGSMDFSQSRPTHPPAQQSSFEPVRQLSQSSRQEYAERDSSDRSTTPSKRTTSMQFSSHPQSTRMSFGRESDDNAGSSTLPSTTASKTIPETRTSDPWASGTVARPIREPSLESSVPIRSRPQKEAAPQPPRQTSRTNSLETRNFDTYGGSTGSSTSTASTNIFDPSTSIFQQQAQSNPVLDIFNSPSLESESGGSMKFDTSPMDFGQSSYERQHNDPWSVPASQSTINSTSTFTSSSASSTLGQRQPPQQSTSGNPDDTDDTMKNLRKTFAGIFGDI